MEIDIPGKPISVNALYRGRRFLTEVGKAIKESNGWQARKQYKGKPLQCDIDVFITFYFATNRSDIDNALKGLLDSLTGILWVDDKQIMYLSIQKVIDKKNPRTKIRVEEIICQNEKTSNVIALVNRPVLRLLGRE